MPQITRDIAQIVAVFVECIFYGVYLVTFAASLQTIALARPELSWKTRFVHQRSTLIVVLLLFIFSTLNLALGLLRILAFMRHDFAGPGGAEQLGQDWINILKPLSVNLQTMVADCVLIYRCWILYSRTLRIVVLPIILYLGGMACTVMTMYIQGNLRSDESSRVNGGRLFPTLTTFWMSTIALNIYTSSMIVLRIWRVESESRGKNTLTPLYATSRLSRLQTVMKAVIESGLLYTITSITVFLTHVTGSNSIFITTAADMQVIGIAFNLILVRVAQHGGGGEGTAIMSGNVVTTAISFAHGITSSGDGHPGHDAQGASATNRHIDCKIITDGDPQTQTVDMEKKD